VYIILWISQSRCLTPISACDPACIWLQYRQDPCRATLHHVGPRQQLTTGHLSQLTSNCSVDIQRVSTASDVGNEQSGCIWFQGFIQVYRNHYLFVIFLVRSKEKEKQW
jgi:hypothetical protein